MTKMTNLLMSSNQIISIAVLKAFLELYDLRLENNFIQDFEPIVKHKFANKNWVREQKVPTETDFMNSFSCNKYEVAQLINKSKQQKEMSDNKYMLIKKYENEVKNSCLKINGEYKLNNLQFTDVFKLTELEAVNSQTIDFAEDQVPTLLLKLKLNDCTFKDFNMNLNPITGIYQMEQLIELDLSSNKIRDISEIGNLTNLKKLFLQNNDIHRINELRNLTKLTYVNLSNNKLIFSEPLNQLKIELLINNNIVTDNITLKNQQKPQLINYKTFLGPNSTENQINELSTIALDFNYSLQIAQKYSSFIKNAELKIENDPVLTDFGFTTEIKATTLTILNCKNLKLPPQNVQYFKTNGGALADYSEVKLMKVPSQITALTINGCQLTNLVGIELLNDLQYLNLKNNCIVSVKQLQELNNLKQLLLDNNLIQDLEFITTNKNYILEWIYYQNSPTDANIQTYLTDIKSNMQLAESKAVFVQQKSKTDQLILQLEKALCTKHQDKILDQSLTIKSDTSTKDFMFVNSLPINSLTLNNCVNIQFAHTPTKITSLAVNSCELTDLTGIEQMKQLEKLELLNNGFNNVKPLFRLGNVTYLTINNSKLTNVIGIENMKQLTYLNLKNNQIVLIEPVKHLSNLKQLLLNNNFIHDLNTQTSHPNYTLEWISHQKQTSDADIQNYLTDINSTSNLNDFKTVLLQNKVKMDELITQYDHQQDQRRKYYSQVHYGLLTINGDQNIKNIYFVDWLEINNLVLNNCQSLRFAHTPTKITSLTVNNTTITSIAGVENMKQLQYIDLRDNCIVSCEPLKHLINLQMLFIDNNCIQDLEFITTLQNYKLDWIYYQRTPIYSDIQNYLKLSNIGAEFAKHFETKAQKTRELIRTGEQSYDEKMVLKYQNKVSGNRLEIKDDKELKDFKFVEKFNITTLYIQSCPNVRFWRTPNNITSFQNVCYCGLKSVRGVEKMKQLQTLGFTDNQIVDISCLKELPNLTSLDVRWNRIVDFSPVRHLINRGQVDNNYQSYPTQQQIDDSKRLW
ncbi:leucine-rich_repeat domain-containing protein [Hexamita inflata]|uniref:Leucine-rich repeat domain-containing protein n=1 Tax=Hexamita inflata TaxID=28002 RepID=A0AA86U3K9_9EUKA|nr:leucine-rich repeat domain-containing protein [Hexamita inflata]